MLKTNQLTCCDSHQFAVVNFITRINTPKLSPIYPPHSTEIPARDNLSSNPPHLGMAIAFKKGAERLAKRPATKTTR